MNIDPRELRQVAAAAVPRFDMYACIHKALRALMADSLLALGRMDPEDALELAQVTQRLMQLLAFCRSHLQHENDFVHRAMEARAPGSSGQIAHEHDEHKEAIDALVGSIPPEEMMFVVRWMVPFMNPAERAAMLGDMRAKAPAPAFAAALDVVRPHLSEREWAKLSASLQLPTVPGLVQA